MVMTTRGCSPHLTPAFQYVCLGFQVVVQLSKLNETSPRRRKLQLTLSAFSVNIKLRLDKGLADPLSLTWAKSFHPVFAGLGSLACLHSSQQHTSTQGCISSSWCHPHSEWVPTPVLIKENHSEACPGADNLDSSLLRLP